MNNLAAAVNSGDVEACNQLVSRLYNLNADECAMLDGTRIKN